MPHDSAIGSSADQLLAGMPQMRVQTRRGSYSYRQGGSGPPLVLLHGIGSGSGSWAHQFDALGARRRVIAWDAPGYGDSTALAQTAPLAADYAGALADFLDGLGLAEISLLGHSLGALMAAAFARLFPERVRHLILASPAGGYGRASPTEREKRTQPRLALMAELGPERHAQARAPYLLSPAASAEDVALVAHGMARLHPAGYAQAVRMLGQGDIMADLAHWPHPLLVVSGTADQVTPEAACRAIARAALHGTYRGIENAGHALYIEQPAAFNDIVNGFVGDAP